MPNRLYTYKMYMICELIFYITFEPNKYGIIFNHCYLTLMILFDQTGLIILGYNDLYTKGMYMYRFQNITRMEIYG